MKSREYSETWNGETIDLYSDDWGEYKDVLSKRQKLFVFWYTMPFQNAHNDITQAAIKSGYTVKSAYKAYDNLFKIEGVRVLVKRFEDRNKKVAYKKVADDLIDQKLRRATYNIKDYYETKEIINPNTEETYKKPVLKSLDDLTREEASIIDNVEVNNSGVATYKLPVREKESADLIKFAQEVNKEAATDGFDIETTVDVVKDNLNQIKATIRINNQKVKENAENYIENTENQPEFD